MADASTKVSLGASIAYITSGTSMAANAFSGATIATALVGSSNLSNYQRCDIVMTYSPASSTSSNALAINVFRRDINLDGNTAYDSTAPDATNTQKYMGPLMCPVTVSTGTYYLSITDVPLPGGNTDCEFWLQNQLTNSIPAGWALTVTPKTDVGATT